MYFSIWFNKVAKFGWRLGDCNLDLSINADLSLNCGLMSLPKCHLTPFSYKTLPNIFLI